MTPRRITADRDKVTRLRVIANGGGRGNGGGRAKGTLPPPSAPMEVARELVDERYTAAAGALTLRHWRGGWWEWDGPGGSRSSSGRWRARRTRSPSTPSTRTSDTIEAVGADRHKIGDLLDALAAVVHLPEDVSMPSWLDGPRYNGLLVSVRATGCSTSAGASCSHTTRGSSTRPASRSSTTRRPNAPARWRASSTSCGATTGDSIDALQQWFGYMISGRLDLHKILLLVGPTRAGKGVTARILGALVGDGERRRADAVEPERRLRARAAARQDAGGRLRRAAERPRRARRRRAAAVDLAARTR